MVVCSSQGRAGRERLARGPRFCHPYQNTARQAARLSDKDGDMTRKMYAAAALLIYAALPVLANWMIGNVGADTGGVHVIPVWFGIYAPSGVLCAGAALGLRDLVQELIGRRG